MQNEIQPIISQYQSSPRLMTILRAVNAWFSPDAPIEGFFANCVDILSAEGQGLDVLGRIVGINRTLTVPIFDTFGFGEAGDRVGFGQGPFDDYITTAQTNNYVLTDPAFRALILAKAAYNITDGSIPSINSILVDILFPGRGNAYVSEGATAATTFGFGEAHDRQPFGLGPFGDSIPGEPSNMQLTYVFTYPLEPFEVAMVTSGVLPKPTGVMANWAFTT